MERGSGIFHKHLLQIVSWPLKTLPIVILLTLFPSMYNNVVIVLTTTLHLQYTLGSAAYLYVWSHVFLRITKNNLFFLSRMEVNLKSKQKYAPCCL